MYKESSMAAGRFSQVCWRSTHSRDPATSPAANGTAAHVIVYNTLYIYIQYKKCLLICKTLVLSIVLVSIDINYYFCYCCYYVYILYSIWYMDYNLSELFPAPPYQGGCLVVTSRERFRGQVAPPAWVCKKSTRRVVNLCKSLVDVSWVATICYNTKHFPRNLWLIFWIEWWNIRGRAIFQVEITETCCFVQN